MVTKNNYGYSQLPKEEIKRLIKEVFSPLGESEANTMIAICTAESGLENKRSYKANSDGSYDHGVCQLNDRWHTDKVGGTINGFYDIKSNIKAAYQIRVGWGSFKAWTKYTNGDFKQYL